MPSSRLDSNMSSSGYWRSQWCLSKSFALGRREASLSMHSETNSAYPSEKSSSGTYSSTRMKWHVR